MIEETYNDHKKEYEEYKKCLYKTNYGSGKKMQMLLFKEMSWLTIIIKI